VVPTDFDCQLALELGLLGFHHAENVAVARTLLEAVLGPHNEAELLTAARGYAPLESRFFQLPPLGEIAVIDDSLATNPLPTIAGLSALSHDRVALIAGGQDRGVDYEPLAQALAERTMPTFVACLAEAGDVIASVTPLTDLLSVEKFASLEEAVAACLTWLSGKGALLLSPAAPSFGQFENYRDRSEAFQRAVDRHR
jgi:UDP-N-acetylmuramoylalanine--D-glutamate ligase